jgi:hypothetical protein
MIAAKYIDSENFDYDVLDSETRIVVSQRAEEIRALLKRTSQDIVDIGRKLIQVKEYLGHGKFLNWIEAEFGCSNDSAERYMNVARRLGQIPHGAEFEAKALYLLTAKSTPEAACQEALHIATQGVLITYTKAQEIVSRYPREARSPKRNLAVVRANEERATSAVSAIAKKAESQVSHVVVAPNTSVGSQEVPGKETIYFDSGEADPVVTITLPQQEQAHGNNEERDSSMGEYELLEENTVRFPCIELVAQEERIAIAASPQADSSAADAVPSSPQSSLVRDPLDNPNEEETAQGQDEQVDEAEGDIDPDEDGDETFFSGDETLDQCSKYIDRRDTSTGQALDAALRTLNY